MMTMAIDKYTPEALADRLKVPSLEALRKALKRQGLIDRFDRRAQLQPHVVARLAEQYQATGNEDQQEAAAALLQELTDEWTPVAVAPRPDHGRHLQVVRPAADNPDSAEATTAPGPDSTPDTDPDPDTRPDRTVDTAPDQTTDSGQDRPGQFTPDNPPPAPGQPDSTSAGQPDSGPTKFGQPVAFGPARQTSPDSGQVAAAPAGQRAGWSLLEDGLLTLITLLAMYVQMAHTSAVVNVQRTDLQLNDLHGWAYAMAVQFTGLAMTLYSGRRVYLVVFGVAEFLINVLYYRPWVTGGPEAWLRDLLLSALIAFTIYSYAEIFTARRRAQ